MKYLIEIWVLGSIVDTHENNDIKEIVKWFKHLWNNIYVDGGCTYFVYENGKELSWQELKRYNLNF